MRGLPCVAACLVTLVVPLAAVGADATKVTIGTRVGLVGAADGSVWAPDQTSRVMRIDARTGKIVARFDTGLRPFHAISANGSVWVTNLNSSTVARIDPATNRVVARIPVGYRPYGLAAGGGS